MGTDAAKVPSGKTKRGVASEARKWAVAEGKARFSELIEKALHAPQTITRNGKPVAVVVGIDQWTRTSARKGTLSEFFQTAPEGFGDLDFSRSPEVARDIEL